MNGGADMSWVSVYQAGNKEGLHNFKAFTIETGNWPDLQIG